MGRTKRTAFLVLLSLGAALAFAEAPADQPRLRVQKTEGGALLLAWEQSKEDTVPGPTIYEGSLETLRAGRWDLEPVDCDTGDDQREEILPTPGSRYYLLVPRQAKRRAEIERGARMIPRLPKPSPCALKRGP